MIAPGTSEAQTRLHSVIEYSRVGIVYRIQFFRAYSTSFSYSQHQRQLRIFDYLR